MDTILNLNTETIRFIIDKAREFQMEGEGLTESAFEERSPSYAELKSTIDDLEPDQQVSLVGLMWLGRGDYSIDESARAFSDAGEQWNERTADYLIGTPLLADYLEEALERLGSE